MKQLLISPALALFFTFHLTAQETSSKWDFRLSAGRSFLGSGDIWINMVENELNYKLNHYFSASISLAYAKGEQEGRGLIGEEEILYDISSFWQTNLNFYISPFQNTRKNDFRLGLGLSAYRIFDVNIGTIVFPVSENIRSLYYVDRRDAIGGIFLLEYARMINEKWLFGTRAFTQSYFNGDINSGVLLKFGRRL